MSNLTPKQTAERIAYLKRIAKEGADKLHAQAAMQKPVKLTDAENAAIARAKIEEGKS
jgi:hypothetical protein